MGDSCERQRERVEKELRYNLRLPAEEIVEKAKAASEGQRRRND